MNISKETLEQLNELYYFGLYNDNVENVPIKDASVISISWDKSDESYIGANLKTPKKKEVTLDWILNKINNDKVYTNFVENFKKLIPNPNINVYPTSYGIGVFVLLNFRGMADKYKLEIEKILNEKQIEYKTEYSEANWVFRYKISKKKENIEKLY